MLKISPIVKKDHNRSVITVSPDGCCSVQEVWKAENEVNCEINLCTEYLSSQKTENGKSTSRGRYLDWCFYACI